MFTALVLLPTTVKHTLAQDAENGLYAAASLFLRPMSSLGISSRCLYDVYVKDPL